MRPVLLLILLAAPVVAQPMPMLPGTPMTSDLSPEEQTVKAAQLPLTGPGLVGFFKQRSQRAAEEGLIKELIKQLGDKDGAVRDKAFGGLVQFGSLAVPLLRQSAAAVDDANVSGRARDCLRLIEGDDSAALVIAAAQLLGRKGGDGSVEALLAYLPFADNPKVHQEVEAVLGELAMHGGKLNPALVRALKDSAAGIRAAAASAICQSGDAAARAEVKPLLKDPRPVVRLRAALGLARRSDAEAIPVLIDLLAELPDEHRTQCEEFLTELAGEWKVEAPQGRSPILQRLQREVWSGWWKGTDGKTLIEEFTRRTLSNAERDKVLGLIRDLGKENEKERQATMLEVVNCGPKALPLLRQAMEDANLRISEAARRCVDQLQKDTHPPLPAVAARLLALHRPEGAAAALLGFVPFADSDTLTEAVLVALVDVAVGKDGKAAPAFLAALNDAVPARRLAAIDTLAQVGGHQEALKKLLMDKDAEIRLKTALALARAGERDVMPTLIQVVSESAPENGWQGDDFLSKLAGAKKPDVVLSKEAEGQKKYREAWSAWWKENGDKVVLLERGGLTRSLGYTLIVEQYNQQNGQGRVLEMDAAGKVRWEIGGLSTPMDARVIGNDRVLIAEQNMNRVSERNFKGEVKWEKQGIGQPIVAERLRNGNTFIIRRNGFLEVDREGREVYHVHRNSDYIMGGGRLRDGTVAFVNNRNMYVRLDRSGKELKSFAVPFDPTGNQMLPWILPNGHVLVAHYGAGKVLELDREGKTIWQGSVQWPHVVTKLSNGNVLVCSIQTRKVTEIDRSGKTVKELTGNMWPYKAERR